MRGDLLDPDVLRIDAVDNFDVYGYFGVSVFAEVGGVDLSWIAGHKLSQASWLVVFHADEASAPASASKLKPSPDVGHIIRAAKL